MDIEKIRVILNKSETALDMPESLKGFNWGAFLLTFIWGIRYKAWITLFAIPLIWLQLPFGLNWILLMILQIYCGIKGNEWAYKIDRKKSDYDFRITQIKWAVFGVFIQIFLPLTIIFLLCLFIFKSPENPINFAQNAQCRVAYNNLRKELPKIDVNVSQEEIAQQFAKRFKKANPADNSVSFFVEGSGQSVELYYIRFLKPENSSCKLAEKNCKIESGFLYSEEIFDTINECIFYFDDYKKISPSEQTNINIQKGYNIFKYL